MEKIKIIIPIYNSAPYLERCINSVLNQSFHDYSIVLVDDGSTDSCPRICDSYAEKDARINVIHQPNMGLSAARNAGIDYPSDSKYLAFIDSDDWVHPQYLELLHMAIEKTKTQMSICGHIRTSRETPFTDLSTTEVLDFSPEQCYCLTSISVTPAWGKLYCSSLFSMLRFPVGKIHEDYYTTWKVLFGLDRIAVIEAPLYYYYYNQSGIMHSSWTPQRLDFLPAMEEKIRYFHENGFENAEKRAIKKLFGTIEKYMLQIEGTKYAEVYLPLLQQWKTKYSI